MVTAIKEITGRKRALRNKDNYISKRLQEAKEITRRKRVVQLKEREKNQKKTLLEEKKHKIPGSTWKKD